MANDTTLLSNWADFMTELMVKEQLVFGYNTRVLSLITGLEQPDAGAPISRDPNQQRFTRAMDPNRDYFHGKQVTIPLQLSEVAGSSTIAENGTWLEPAPFDTDQATLNLVSRVTPVGLTLELERDARNGATSALEAVAGITSSAFRAAAKLDNDYVNGNGDAILASATAANSDADGLTMTVLATTNFDALPPGRVVDVCTTAYADPGQGKRRKIASVDRTAGTVTFSTTQVASDGGSGNITLSTNGLVICVEGAISSTGKAPNGLQQVTAATGTFEGIDKASVSQWQGVSVDGNSGTLSTDLLDTAMYQLGGNGGDDGIDFGYAHPLTVDPFKNSLQSQVRTSTQEVVVRAGVKGIVYQGGPKEFPIIKELAAPREECRLINKNVVRIYGDGNGPDFINDDGSMWRFFSRKSTKEADLYDRWQLAARDCGKTAEIVSLSE